MSKKLHPELLLAFSNGQRFVLNRNAPDPIVVAIGFRDWIGRRLLEEK